MPKYADPAVYPVGTPAATDNVMTRTAAGADGNFALGNLAGIAGLTAAADLSLYYNGTAWATYTVTSVGRTLLAATTQAAQRTALGAADDTAVVHLTGNETIGGTKTFSSTLQVDANVQILGGASGVSRFIRIGSGRTADGPSYLDFISGTVNADYDFRFYRDTGVNGMSTFSHRGTGQLVFNGIDGTTLTFRTNSADRFSILPSAGGVRTHVNFIPNADNTLDVGQPAARFRTYYGVNSAINTSDARLKTEPRQQSDAERKVGSALAREPMIWEWLTGDRLHAGPTVQAAMAVMAEHGLDPFAYSFICYDEWEAEPEQWHEWPSEEAVYEEVPDPLYGENGTLLSVHRTKKVLVKEAVEAGRELIQPAREAGDRYSFRKEELLCFMVSALAAENDLQAAKVEAFDARLAALEAKA